MAQSFQHFRGKSGSDTRRKRKSSHRERDMKRGTSENRYAQHSKVGK